MGVGFGLLERDDLVIALIERGTDKVIHGRVNDGKGLGRGFLDVLHGAEKHAGIADHEAARLKKNAQAERLQDGHDSRGVILRRNAARVIGGLPPRRDRRWRRQDRRQCPRRRRC